MLKRILVVLDGSAIGNTTQKIAVDMAQTMKAQLTGVGIIDTPWITAAQPEPLGGAAYKLHRDEEVIRQTRERIKTVLNNFEETCQKNNISCRTCELEGFPATEIENLSEEHDLILIGHTTDFHFDLDQDTDLTVKHITRDNPRPLIVVTGEYKKEGPILIAYDGSLQAARALHMYILLGLVQNKKVHIVSIARKAQDAENIAIRARHMCESHDITVVSEGVASSDAPEKIILQKAEEVNASLIVMGAFGHRGLRELFFGSCTEHIIKKAKSPLFIHH